MGLKRALTLKAASLVVVLLFVLLLTTIIIGATGISDKILNGMVQDNLRAIRQELAREIRNPEDLERALEKIKEDLIRSYGLDKPWYVRMPDMIWRIVTLDLGNSRTVVSFSGSNKISDIILERLPNTVLLMITVLIINFALSLMIGVRVATKPGSFLDRLISMYSAVSYALPTWWLGILMILVFAFYLKIFPFGGMYSTPPPVDPLVRSLDLVWHLCLPVLTLVIATSGSWIYITRSIVITTAQEDFVSIARAKGLSERIVLWRYIIRPAAPPILTNLILSLAAYLGGAILTETIFSWPGMGLLYFEAIMSVDEALILALTYMYTLIYVIARFVLEVLYVIVDPRVRYA
ncbi:MAG: ABC transporter permease [Candidatus Nezhaarchaeales archaeon]|nr:MAG: ABC transporter permease [Candidatus Nezhaarchaeota archaeon WYZ-LMO8]TDA37083.1 MAG: ABC transporter permease [Candidatus Nezhaarchaeota archaeon WYZ-LMO7]